MQRKEDKLSYEMNKLERFYEISPRDIRKRKLLRIAPWAAPFLISLPLPLISLILALVFAVNPASVAFFLFLAVISLIVSVLIGIAVAIGLLMHRQKWLKNMREKIAMDGVRASEIDWFETDLTTNERKTLAEVESRNLLLGDAYRETLASRLTATKIVETVKREQQVVIRRRNKVKYLKSANASELISQLQSDQERLDELRKEAETLRVDAETRLYQIESAARRGVNFSETELSLKQLSSRTIELPLALQTMQIEQDTLDELSDNLKNLDNLK